MRHGLIAGITTFLLLVGTGVSYAAWTAGAQATSTASAATLALSTSGFDSNAFTFQNHRLATTGSVTLTNTTDTPSTTAGTYRMTLGYTGSAALASALTVAAWPTTTPATCAAIVTPPPGTVTGSWDTVATAATPLSGPLAKGASASYCIRVTSGERGDLASSNGSLAIQPSISATLEVGNWSQSASSTTTQQTAWIFPAFGATPNTWYQVRNQGTGKCLDVYGASAASGTGAIDYGCKSGNSSGDYNQQWKFTRTTGDYFDVTPRHAPLVRLDVTGGSTASLAPVDAQTDDAARESQEWQLQEQPGSVYQLVNRKSGLCLQVNNTSFYTPEIEYAQVVCDGSAGQRYALVVKDVDVPAMTLSCAAAPNGGVTYSWTGAAIDTYNFEAKPDAGSTWSAIGDAAAGATSFTVLPAAVSGADGQYNMRALWLTNQLATSNLWKTTTGGVASLGCSAPLPILNAVTCSPSPDRAVTIAWGHAAPSTYTIQLWSNGGWINNGTATTGSTSYTIAGNQNWFDGVRTMRVVSGSVNVEFEVYNSGYASSYLWCLPPQQITATCQNSATDGDYITLSWTRTSTGTSSVRVTLPGISSFTRPVSISGTTASVQIRDDEVRYATAGNSIPTTFRLEADSVDVGLLPDLNIRITGTGTNTNSKNIYCS